MGCCYHYTQYRSYAAPEAGLIFFETLHETPLQVVVMTSMQTGILLLIATGLLLHKDAGRGWEREG